MRMARKITFNVALDEPVIKMLKACAKKNNITVSEVIRLSINNFLSCNGNGIPEEFKRKLIK